MSDDFEIEIPPPFMKWCPNKCPFMGRGEYDVADKTCTLGVATNDGEGSLMPGPDCPGPGKYVVRRYEP